MNDEENNYEEIVLKSTYIDELAALCNYYDDRGWEPVGPLYFEKKYFFWDKFCQKMRRITDE